MRFTDTADGTDAQYAAENAVAEKLGHHFIIQVLDRGSDGEAFDPIGFVNDQFESREYAEGVADSELESFLATHGLLALYENDRSRFCVRIAPLRYISEGHYDPENEGRYDCGPRRTT